MSDYKNANDAQPGEVFVRDGERWLKLEDGKEAKIFEFEDLLAEKE